MGVCLSAMPQIINELFMSQGFVLSPHLPFTQEGSLKPEGLLLSLWHHLIAVWRLLSSLDASLVSLNSSKLHLICGTKGGRELRRFHTLKWFTLSCGHHLHDFAEALGSWHLSIYDRV